MNRWGTTLLLSLTAVLTLTQCAAPPQEGADTAAPAQQAQDAGTAVVGEDGFSIALDGVTVRAPAGVAPVGTTVEVATTAKPLPERWGGFATTLADGIDIRIGDGLQPQAPVTISYPDLKPGSEVFVVAESADGSGDVLDQPAGAAFEVTTEHLSGFWPVLVNLSDFARDVTRSVTDMLQLTSPTPDCFVRNGRYPDLDMRISEVRDDVVWPCLSRGVADDVALALQSNSPLAWRTKTAPAWKATPPTAYSAANIVALSAWRTTSPNAADEVMLLPGEEVTFATTAPPASTSVGLLIDPVLSQVRALALGLDFLLPAKVTDRVARSECLPDLLRSGAVSNTPSATGFAAIIRCFGSAIGGGGGALVSLLAGAPAALWAQLEGALRSAFGQDDVLFTVENTDEDAVGSGDPIDRAAVEAWLGEWTGPITQSGAPEYSVKMNLTHNGRTVVGTVEYPELACSGQLDDARLDNSLLSIEETITVRGRCVSSVDLELTLLPGEIHYHFDRSGGGDGVLRRP